MRTRHSGGLEYAQVPSKRPREADLVIEAVPEEMESKIEDPHPARQDLPAHDDAGLEHFIP